MMLLVVFGMAVVAAMPAMHATYYCVYVMLSLTGYSKEVRIREGFTFFIVGHTCHELFALRTGKIGRIPDVVVWPGILLVHILS